MTHNANKKSEVAAPLNQAADNKLDTGHCNRTLTIRQKRTARALLDNPHGISRLALDGLIGTNNAPEYIKQLRRKNICIITHDIGRINRFGEKSHCGMYKLAAKDKDRLQAMLETD